MHHLLWMTKVYEMAHCIVTMKKLKICHIWGNTFWWVDFLVEEIWYFNITVLRIKLKSKIIWKSNFCILISLCRSSFAVNGAECTLNEEVAKCIKDFHAAKKPIGWEHYRNINMSYLAGLDSYCTCSPMNKSGQRLWPYVSSDLWHGFNSA